MFKTFFRYDQLNGYVWRSFKDSLTHCINQITVINVVERLKIAQLNC